jgi:hypothetical protein
MPIARVQMPDGRVARFEVPADMSPQDIEALAQTNIDELQQQQTQQQQAIPQPEQPKKSVFEWASDAIGDQIDSLSNFPKNPERIAHQTFEQARPGINDAIATAGMMSIPTGLLNTGLKRVATGAAGGASREDGLEDKLKGAASGASLSMLAESIPVIQGMAAAGKRVLYDPRFNQDRIIGATLKRFAEDPNNPNVLARTENALNNSKQFIRGSNPTTAQAGGNAGLWALDKALMSRDQAAYRYIADAQNLARVKALKELGLSEGAKKQGLAFQDEAIRSLDQAKGAGANINLKPVDDLIESTLGTGAGKQTQVRSALEKLQNLLRDKSGNLETNLDQIQGIRNEIGVMLSGKLAGDAGNVRFASGQVGSVKGAIDDAIEQALASSGNPGLHRAFVDKYRQGAQLINRVDDLNTLLQRSSSTGQVPEIGMIGAGAYGPTGAMNPGEILSPAKLNNFLKSDAWKKASKNLTPVQADRVSNVQKDLLRSVPLDIKRGSDTFQNMATDYVMQGIANEGLVKGLIATAGKGVGKLEKAPGIGGLMNFVVPSSNVLENPELRQGLLKAMTDPKYAAKLMKGYREFSPVGLGDVPSRLQGQGMIWTQQSGNRPNDRP